MLLQTVKLYSTSFLLLLLAVDGELDNCPEDCGLWFDGCNFCLCHDDEDKGLEAGCTNLTCAEFGESFCASQKEDIVEDDIETVVDESQPPLDGVCEDDPDWVDDKFDGDGASTCADLKIKWCYNYGEYSAEARRACPKTCGLCMAECSDVSERVQLNSQNHELLGCFSRSWPVEEKPSACARSFVVRKAGGSFYNVPCSVSDDGVDEQWTCMENWDCATLHTDQVSGGLPTNGTTPAPVVAPEVTPSPTEDLAPSPVPSPTEPETTPAPTSKPDAALETVEVAKILRGLSSEEQARDTAPAMQEALKRSGISATVTIKSVEAVGEEAAEQRRRRLTAEQIWKVIYKIVLDTVLTSREKLLETVAQTDFDNRMAETIKDDLRIEVEVQPATVDLEKDKQDEKDDGENGSNMAVLGGIIGGSVVILGCLGYFLYWKGCCGNSSRRRSSGGSMSAEETAGFKPIKDQTRKPGEVEGEYAV